MQLMCPSCCGGSLSDNKGSVYTKRKSTNRKSETKSAAITECSEIDVTVKIEASDTTNTTHPEETTAEVSEPISADRPYSPIPEEPSPKSNAEERIRESTPTPTEENEQLTFVAPEQPKRPELVRGVTIEEKMDIQATHGVLHKNRSLSLSETISHNINEELNQKLKSDEDEPDDFKWYNNQLRKTSFPNGNGNGQPKNEQTIELKIGGKECVEIKKQHDENEPPFNFQAVLRKTNTDRQSLRRSSSASEKFNFEAELFPGVVLRGMIYDL